VDGGSQGGAVAGYHRVLEDGPETCSSESTAQSSKHGEEYSDSDMLTDLNLIEHCRLTALDALPPKLQFHLLPFLDFSIIPLSPLPFSLSSQLMYLVVFPCRPSNCFPYCRFLFGLPSLEFQIIMPGSLAMPVCNEVLLDWSSMSIDPFVSPMVDGGCAAFLQADGPWGGGGWPLPGGCFHS
jgi:hypothetical protein